MLEAAARLVQEQGPESLKMTELAAIAGVSAGTLYQYFPDRVAVLTALAGRVCDAHLEHFRGFVGMMKDASLDEFLRALSVGAAHETMQHRALKAVTQREYLKMAGEGDLIDSSEEYVAILAEALGRYLDASQTEVWTTCQTMVWTGDGIIDGVSRLAPQLSVEEVSSRLFAAWNGIVGLHRLRSQTHAA